MEYHNLSCRGKMALTWEHFNNITDFKQDEEDRERLINSKCMQVIVKIICIQLSNSRESIRQVF